jgi:ribosomal protein S18 acetylase RimI-like enzyme
MNLDIRDAGASDEADWRRLWAGHLAFHQADLPSDVTDHTWRRILDPASPMSMRVACRQEVVVGFATYFPHPSSWIIGDDCYLEDLYVDESQRGQGVGRALIDDLIALATARGWQHLYWHTRVNNVSARGLYDKYGTADNVRYRMRLPRPPVD